MKFTLLFATYILSLFYVVLAAIVYFSKIRIDNEENKIYKRILIANIIGVIIQILCEIFIFSKLLLIYFVFWIHFFFIYVLEISKIENKLLKRISLIIACVFSLTVFFLPYALYIDPIESKYYTYGLDTRIIYFISIIYTIAISVIVFLKNKTIVSKKAIPIYLLVFLFVASGLIQFFFPYITIIVPGETLVCLVMYFTIENPDVRLVEYEKREKELAQSANEAKSAFLSSMSHELRTPLNAIVGLSEDMLSYKEQVPSEVKEDCDDIINASNTLLEIIGNILDISKIEGGKLELVESDYLPKVEIESLLKIMRTKVEEKDLQFNVYIDPGIPECLYGDRLRIKQIINNFLSNAIKYTEKGSIDFGARWVDNSLELKVRDTGRGIKKEDRDKLFEKFERLHVEKTSAVQGTGLGLAITKNLVDLMGGTIKVDSEFGVGSTFDVIIPQKIGNKDNIVREALTVEEKHNVDFTGKKVLIVDDNKLNIKVLRKAIQLFNFEIDECYNGEEALKKIGENSYDLIFMDIMMPVMGGEETMGILKQNPDFKTPVLALTADATTGAKERYLSMGFIDYLAKPFSRDTISTKLENVFKDTK